MSFRLKLPQPWIEARTGAMAGTIAANRRRERRWNHAALRMSAWLGSSVVGGMLLRRVYLGPLIQRSEALRGATVTLRSVTPARAPNGDASAAFEDRDFRYLDVTLTPSERHRLRSWRPADLELVAPGGRAGWPDGERQVGAVLAVEIWRNGRYCPQSIHQPLSGSQRIRLLVRLAPHTRRFRIRYYLELLRRSPARRRPQPAPAAARRSGPLG